MTVRVPDGLVFDAAGLIPVVVQDRATGDVLMVAFANSEALALTAAVFTATLSAPARSRASASSTERTPPPTVKGRNTVSATRRTMSSTMGRASEEAVMSRNTSSSAPSAS